MYDVIIVGAGVAGGFMARELSRYKLNILLLDKENDVGNATSMANSAIIHAGYDAKSGSKKADFNSKGNKMYDKICEDLDVEFKRCGSLVLAFTEADKITLESLYQNGIKNDVPDLKILDEKETRELEPNLSPKVCGSLYAPTAGIISPFTLSTALAEMASENGVEIKLETEVLKIDKIDGGYALQTNKGEFKTKYIVNACGVYADKLHDMVGTPYFTISARKGSYYLLDKEAGGIVNRVIFQCPSDVGKGILISPTVHGNVLVGPDAHVVDDKDDKSTDAQSLGFVKENAFNSCEKIPFGKNIRVFAGLRATSDRGDFILEESPSAPGVLNIAGFESPGLSAIPAVAEYMVGIFKDVVKRMENIELVPKDDYKEKRRKQVRFYELSKEEKIEKLRENPQYGRIICRCENISEAEIVDAIHRYSGARSLKAIKKRVRPGSGRCQGGFCAPLVQEILSRELNMKMEDIPYDGTKSYILTGETKS